MLQSIRLKNFKSHCDTHLELGNLTLLCGQNGVGKSSIIQSFLLLRQSYIKNRLHEGLDLNKPLCEIGMAQDAIYQYAQENHIIIELETALGEYHWQFAINENNLQSTFLELVNQPKQPTNEQVLTFLGNKFQYLSAARLAPQESYPKDDYEVERNRQLSIEKGQGELVAHFLHHYGQRINVQSSTMLNPHSRFTDLLSQTTAWEKEISQNININILDVGRGYEVKYNFEVEDGLPTTDFRAENVGFGVTYALPLIVAILSADPGTLILIENPEAHLHPYGQAKLAELMALAAQSGIQIIIETHSDHFINGVLVASKKYEISGKGIDRQKVRIYYLERDEKLHATTSIEIPIIEGGKIKHQPKGFFDQIENDLEILLGF